MTQEMIGKILPIIHSSLIVFESFQFGQVDFYPSPPLLAKQLHGQIASILFPLHLLTLSNPSLFTNKPLRLIYNNDLNLIKDRYSSMSLQHHLHEEGSTLQFCNQVNSWFHQWRLPSPKKINLIPRFYHTTINEPI